jgi:hypothetical protein
MALDIYSQTFPYINGSLLAESVSVQTGLESDDQRIMTLLKGFAGITPSPDVRVVKIENVIPSTGFEFNFEKAKKDRQLIEIKLQLSSGKSMTSKGFITHVTVESGVGKTTQVSLDFVGEPSIFE